MIPTWLQKLHKQRKIKEQELLIEALNAPRPNVAGLRQNLHQTE
jgi:hypothetical protein